MRKSLLVILLISVAVLALVAMFFIVRQLTSQPSSGQASFPADAWATTTPEEQGLDSDKLADGLLAIQGQGSKIDSLLAIRDGKVLLDADFYPYDSAYMHDLASVTKSFMTTLIGIAIDQGRLELDDKVLSFFPDRAIANRDAWKESMTVRDLVSMRNGFESGCSEGDLPTLAVMMSQEDWVQAALDREMVAAPGTTFCYDSPGIHLLSAILQQATGMTAEAFARQYLFAPLGIQESYWLSDPQGYTRGWGDLHLKPADAARLGLLWLNNGEWNDQRVVSAKWVKDSVQYHSDNGGGDGYGYGWWLWDNGYGAEGRGGQSVKVVPAMNVIVATTGGGFDYDREIDPYLTGAVVSLGTALPANPEGLARLNQAVSDLAQPETAQAVPPLPETAKAISGKTYTLAAPNQANLAALSLTFDDSSEATLQRQYTGSDEVFTSKVGLDGIYRPSSEGELLRGYWLDAQTFIVQIKDATAFDLRISFDGDEVTLLVPELDLVIEGAAKD